MLSKELSFGEKVFVGTCLVGLFGLGAFLLGVKGWNLLMIMLFLAV